MDALRRALDTLIGEPARLPPPLANRFPELARLRLRRGGLPVRVAGWALGRPTVAAITLWRTIFVAPGVPLEALFLRERASTMTAPIRTPPVTMNWYSTCRPRR